MKQYLSCLFVLAIFTASSCSKDSLTAPESTLTGTVNYKGEPIGVRSTGIQFEIWQSGYQLFTRIPLNIKQDGSFSALLFNGDYKIVRARGAGPWADNSDTINVKINGSATVDIPVEPYFTISNALFEKSGNTIKGTFTVGKITTSKTLELARLYIGPNLILDQNNNSANAQVLASAITIGAPVSVSVNIPAALANDSYLFVRAGVKTNGTAELLYTTSQKVMLK